MSLLSTVLQSVTAPRERCFKAEVEKAIGGMLETGSASIEQVAATLAMSRQTLYRRLKAEGVTFEELLDAKRRQLAIVYLGQRRLSVKAAAYKLNFSDPAAFSRAFKRWMGVSPSEFRSAAPG